MAILFEIPQKRKYVMRTNLLVALQLDYIGSTVQAKNLSFTIQLNNLSGTLLDLIMFFTYCLLLAL